MHIDFATETKHLIGLRVSHAWKGYGSAISLELGVLETPAEKRGRNARGETCIMIEWDWRVEEGERILFGSSNSGTEIVAKLQQVTECHVENLSLSEGVPELIVSLSNGNRILCCAMVTGDPQWTIRLAEDQWLRWAGGALRKGCFAVELSEAEVEEIENADRVVSRWGTPQVPPIAGECRDCASFVRIDGQYSLLDYGVCTSATSPMDGRVVYCGGGCTHFYAQ